MDRENVSPALLQRIAELEEKVKALELKLSLAPPFTSTVPLTPLTPEDGELVREAALGAGLERWLHCVVADHRATKAKKKKSNPKEEAP